RPPGARWISRRSPERIRRSSATSTTTAWGGRATMTTRPVIRAARFVLAHVPDLVYAGSKPRRETAARGRDVRTQIRARLRTFREAVAYAPHQVMIGNQAPEGLWDLPPPWHLHSPADAPCEGPAGAVVHQPTSYPSLAPPH